jgi:hypothetical protein
MVSGRFLAQGREWWGIGRFSRRYLGGLAARENTCGSRAGADGFGRESMKRAELCAVERGCTDASSTPSVFKRDLFYEKLGHCVLGTL